MVASGRIDISSQTGCCDGCPVTVTRSQPMILEGHMGQFAWNSFCDKIDEALESATRSKKVMGAGGGASATIGVMIMVTGFVLGMQAHASVSSSGESGSPMMGFALFGAGMAVTMLGCVGSACYAEILGTRAKKNMRKVCDEMTAMHPLISFHVHDEMRFWTIRYGRCGGGYHGGGYTETTNYIEVYVTDITDSTSSPVSVAEGLFAVPSASSLQAMSSYLKNLKDEN